MHDKEIQRVGIFSDVQSTISENEGPVLHGIHHSLCLVTSCLFYWCETWAMRAEPDSEMESVIL